MQMMVDISTGLALEENAPDLGYELRKKSFGLTPSITITLNKHNLRQIAMEMFSVDELKNMTLEKALMEKKRKK